MYGRVCMNDHRGDRLKKQPYSCTNSDTVVGTQKHVYYSSARV